MHNFYIVIMIVEKAQSLSYIIIIDVVGALNKTVDYLKKIKITGNSPVQGFS